MKLIHTSDWHLGQNFMFRQRTCEHEQFLSWLYQTIKINMIDLLVVAGDIFDTATPPNYALKLYYQFLASLNETACQNVIIISGNHDSAAVLNAPKHVLKALNVHVVASAKPNIEDEVIFVNDEKNNPTSVVCAVPFLREQDLRKSIPGESWDDKNKALINGLQSHYQTVADKALAMMKQKNLQHLPMIATGHLFATGGLIGEDDHIRQIHLGNLGQFNVNRMPSCFDYIALGHLHKCQKVSGHNHIRYSGSPIPLSFGESVNSKYILTIDFKNPVPAVEKIKIPQFQTLVRIKGSCQKIINQIQQYGKIQKDNSEASDETWVEITIVGEWDPMMEDEIKKAAEPENIKIFVMKRELTEKSSSSRNKVPAKDLNQLTCQAVFEQRLEAIEDLSKDRKKELIMAFNEIEALTRQDEAKPNVAKQDKG